MKKIQLGSFLFSEVEGRPDKVFIQIVEDGEGGNFRWAQVPDAVKHIYTAEKNAVKLWPNAYDVVDDLMWKFWEENF